MVGLLSMTERCKTSNIRIYPRILLAVAKYSVVALFGIDLFSTFWNAPFGVLPLGSACTKSAIVRTLLKTLSQTCCPCGTE